MSQFFKLLRINYNMRSAFDRKEVGREDRDLEILLILFCNSYFNWTDTDNCSSLTTTIYWIIFKLIRKSDAIIFKCSVRRTDLIRFKLLLKICNFFLYFINSGICSFELCLLSTTDSKKNYLNSWFRSETHFQSCFPWQRKLRDDDFLLKTEACEF